MVKPFDGAALREVVEFAGNFVRAGALGPLPRRFQAAPWLIVPPNELDAC